MKYITDTDFISRSVNEEPALFVLLYYPLMNAEIAEKYPFHYYGGDLYSKIMSLAFISLTGPAKNAMAIRAIKEIEKSIKILNEYQDNAKSTKNEEILVSIPFLLFIDTIDSVISKYETVQIYINEYKNANWVELAELRNWEEFEVNDENGPEFIAKEWDGPLNSSMLMAEITPFLVEQAKDCSAVQEILQREDITMEEVIYKEIFSRRISVPTDIINTNFPSLVKTMDYAWTIQNGGKSDPKMNEQVSRLNYIMCNDVDYYKIIYFDEKISNKIAKTPVSRGRKSKNLYYTEYESPLEMVAMLYCCMSLYKKLTEGCDIMEDKKDYNFNKNLFLAFSRCFVIDEKDGSTNSYGTLHNRIFNGFPEFEEKGIFYETAANMLSDQLRNITKLKKPLEERQFNITEETIVDILHELNHEIRDN